MRTRGRGVSRLLSTATHSCRHSKILLFATPAELEFRIAFYFGGHTYKCPEKQAAASHTDVCPRPLRLR